MELILASAGGAEKRFLDCDFDFSVGIDNNFEITIPYSEWKNDIQFDDRVYIPNTEFGGIIKDIEGDTSKDSVFIRGFTWRGYWEKRFFKGSVSGELNSFIRALSNGFSGVFRCATYDTGISVSSNYIEPTTYLDIIDGLAKLHGYKIVFKYVQTQDGGYVEVDLAQSFTFGGEVSQDSFLNFSSEDNRMGVNHLIVSNGDLTVDVYADGNGNIGTTPYYVGIQEIAAYYSSGKDNATYEELVNEGKEQLQELISYKSLITTLDNIDSIDMDVGDYVTGVDYITGVTITKRITGKIATCLDDVLSYEYIIEDD